MLYRLNVFSYGCCNYCCYYHYDYCVGTIEDTEGKEPDSRQIENDRHLNTAALNTDELRVSCAHKQHVFALNIHILCTVIIYIIKY